ncbi:hypothetical protein FGADI_9191 [Fusarium gaditjirri]|uniref:Protein kinase domain-containing protein n=1 Tax=Fusarium gaditjirri TaxID=282569 RepID=A0A8H4T034_9HYPO|nr:hypothetical protein FGADI_9191 [Fusarium gaditjirri]
MSPPASSFQSERSTQSLGMEILQGQRWSVEQTLTQYQELWDSASDDSSDNEDKTPQKTELGQNLMEIASIISDLFKLSFKLRNPAARSTGPPIMRALSHRQMIKLDESDESTAVDLFSLYTEFYKAHVEEIFTQWRLESWLQETPQSHSSITPHSSETLALSETEFTLPRRHVDTVSNNGSTVSRISTAYNIDETVSSLPPAPTLAPDEMEARCPYCHLLSHEAQIHRKVFRCFEHPENFSSQESLENHLKSSHHELGRGQIEAILGLGQASHQEERVSCPFCLSTGPFSRGFSNHLAYHQERLACFAATGQSLNQDDGLYSDIDSDKAQVDDDPDALRLLESDTSSWGSSTSKDSESFPTPKTEITVSLGREIRQALVQSNGPEDDSDAEQTTSLISSKYLPIDQLNRIITYESILNELKRLESLEEPELSRRALEIHGDIDLERHTKPDTDPAESTSISTASSPTRKKIFAILVLLGKAQAISDICDEGLSDDDLPFDLDPNGLRLVRRNATSSQPIQAFIHWKEHESYMFDSYQCVERKPPGYALVKTFRDAEEKDYDLRFDSLITIAGKRHPHISQLLLALSHGKTQCFIFQWAEYDLMRFWMVNSPEESSIDLVQWISSQLFGLADALQLIRNLFPTEVLTGGGYGLLPTHRDLIPESILYFGTSGATRGVLKIAGFGSMQFHDEQLYHQRGSGSCTNSAYRAPEMVTGEMAYNSDLWSLGCIILHFMVWSHGGWEMVNSLSASNCVEEEDTGAQDDKFFKYRNSKDVTEDDTERNLYDKGTVLKESVQMEISRLLDESNGQFTRDIMGLVERDLQTDARGAFKLRIKRHHWWEFLYYNDFGDA